MSDKMEARQLGGWLILVGIGIVVSPFKISLLIYNTYPELFNVDIWRTLTSPESAHYNPFWAPFIFTELAINCGLVLGWLVIGYKFFLRRQGFPQWYIGIALFTLVFIFLDALALKLILPDEPLFNKNTGTEFIRSLIMVLIWVPYMLFSTRVKATFLR